MEKRTIIGAIKFEVTVYNLMYSIKFYFIFLRVCTLNFIVVLLTYYSANNKSFKYKDISVSPPHTFSVPLI